MSQREKWTFQFAAGVVLDAADQRVRHHQQRLVHWLARVEAAKADLKDSGIDWREAVDKRSRYPSSQYVDQPVFDTLKLEVLREAQERVAHHRKEKDAYETWMGVLATSERDRLLDLDFADVVYFGLMAPTPPQIPEESDVS